MAKKKAQKDPKMMQNKKQEQNNTQETKVASIYAKPLRQFLEFTQYPRISQKDPTLGPNDSIPQAKNNKFLQKGLKKTTK